MLNPTGSLRDTASQREDKNLEITLTPMIDVFLQLIIFVMCIANFKTSDTWLHSILPIPSDMAMEGAEPETLEGVEEIYITFTPYPADPFQPNICINGSNVSSHSWLANDTDDAERVYHIIKAATKRSKVSVIIQPHKEVPTQPVVDIINACKKAGITPYLVGGNSK